MSNPPSSSSQLAASGAQQQGAGSGSGGSSTTVELGQPSFPSRYHGLSKNRSDYVLGDLKDKLAKWAAMKEKLGTDDAVTHFLSVVGTDSIVDKEPKKEQTRLERAGKSIEKGAEMLKAQKVDSTIQVRNIRSFRNDANVLQRIEASSTLLCPLVQLVTLPRTWILVGASLHLQELSMRGHFQCQSLSSISI